MIIIYFISISVLSNNQLERTTKAQFTKHRKVVVYYRQRRQTILSTNSQTLGWILVHHKQMGHLHFCRGCWIFVSTHSCIKLLINMIENTVPVAGTENPTNPALSLLAHSYIAIWDQPRETWYVICPNMDSCRPHWIISFSSQTTEKGMVGPRQTTQKRSGFQFTTVQLMGWDFSCDTDGINNSIINYLII